MIYDFCCNNGHMNSKFKIHHLFFFIPVACITTTDWVLTSNRSYSQIGFTKMRQPYYIIRQRFKTQKKMHLS